MRTIEAISRLPKNEQRNLYKKCFDIFVDNQDTYRPNYNVDGYQIERRYFLLYVKNYYDMYSSHDERRLYDTVISSKKDNKFEKLKNKYREAFIMYLKNQDTEDYYEYLANESRISIQTAKRYPFHYYDKYASDEERQIFDQVKNNKSEIAVEEKENNTKDKLKYMFDICVNSKFDDQTVENLTEKYSISPKTVRNYVNQYYDSYATDIEKNKYQEARNEIKKQRENNARYVRIFNYVLECKSIEEAIVYLLKQKNLNMTYLKTSINPYSFSFPEADINKLNIIIDKYIKYIKYCNEKKEQLKNQKIETAKEIEIQKNKIKEKVERQKELIINLVKLVKSYNNSNFKNYNDFCKKYKIIPKQFECAIKVTSKADKEVYNQYLNKVRLQYRKKYVEESKVIEKVINCIKDNPKYSLLDYYYLTKINLDELNQFVRKICTKEEFLTFEKFYEKYKNEKTINPAIIIKAEYMINSYGQQIQLDDNTKLKIINKLKEDNIPITPKIYLEAVRRKIELIHTKQKSKVA